MEPIRSLAEWKRAEDALAEIVRRFSLTPYEIDLILRTMPKPAGKDG